MASEFTNPDAIPACVVEERWYDVTVVLSCSGVIDMLTAPHLEESLASVLAKQPSAVIVDLSKVDFLASRGMGVLIEMHDRITPDIGFAVVADGPATSRPLKLIGVADVINMHSTLDAALVGLDTRRTG